MTGLAVSVEGAGRFLLQSDEFTGIERLATSSSDKAGFRAKFAALIFSVSDERKPAFHGQHTSRAFMWITDSHSAADIACSAAS